MQLLIVVGLGVLVGRAYAAHRARADEWGRTHFRLHESAHFSVREGLPFAGQFILDDWGRRVALPIPSPGSLDFREATWWSERHEEVLPVYRGAR